jgi:hydrogenase maturation protease
VKAPRPRILALGLGNDILADDAVGLVAARSLRRHYGDEVEVVEAAESGLALLDFLEGRSHALLLDAILTGRHPAGTVLEFSREDFDTALGTSSHYAGIPEVLALAECLGVSVPTELFILAMEVEDLYSLREGLSVSVDLALPGYVAHARRILDGWSRQSVRSSRVRRSPCVI